MPHEGYKIRVQYDIPMPVIKPRGRTGTREPKYPWRTMRVGGSFLFPPGVGRAGHAAADPGIESNRPEIRGRKDGRRMALLESKMIDGTIWDYMAAYGYVAMIAAMGIGMLAVVALILWNALK